MAEESNAPAAAAAARPQKPDEALYKEQLEKAEKTHKEVMNRFNAVKAKIDLAQPNKNKEGAPSPVEKRRQELIAELKEIRTKQAGGKTARTSKMDQIKRLDEQLKSRINEQKTAKSKVSYKSVEDIDRQIDSLDKQVNGGMMKLVDEKKALAEISNLKKTRKNFAQFDTQQKDIDDLRAKIKAIKDTMDNPEQKALSEQYDKLQAELDGIKAQQDEAYKGLSSLRDERSKLYNEQRESFEAIRKVKDDYWGQKKAFMSFEREAKQKAWERKQAERERYDKEKKMERAQRMLADASDPAYLDEIRRANSLLIFFDPSSKPAEKAPLLASSGMTAQASRTVDASGIKGTAIVSKKDRDDEYLPAVKKGKKGKKGGAAATPDAKGFNCPPAVIDDCSYLKIDPPASAADIPGVIEKIKEKLDHWKGDQAAQTKRNVDKAKKEIEALEKEEAEAETNGAKGDDKAVAEATDAVKDASLEDKKEVAAAA